MSSRGLVSKSSNQRVDRQIAAGTALAVVLVSSLCWPVAALATSPQSGVAQSRDVSHGESPREAETPSPRQEPVQAKKKTEAEETQEYRHSASVQWLAKLLHVDVETAATLFEWINFAVIAIAIGIPFVRVVPAALRKRSAQLSVDLEQAQARTDDANLRLRAVESKLAGLDLEIAAIRKQMETDLVTDEARHKAHLEEESARIVAAAEQEIAMAAAQAQRGLKQFAADLAIDRAMSQLTLNDATDRALFAEFGGEFVPKPGRARKSEAN